MAAGNTRRRRIQNAAPVQVEGARLARLEAQVKALLARYRTELAANARLREQQQAWSTQRAEARKRMDELSLQIDALEAELERRANAELAG